MKPLCVLLVGVVVGWAASGVDWSRDAVGEETPAEKTWQPDRSLPGAPPLDADGPDEASGIDELFPRDAGQVEVYKVLTRVQIEVIGGRKKIGGIIGFHDFSYLTAGLNALANDGWYLSVIEPAHAYSISGPGNAKANEPSAYIFEKR